MVSGPKTARTMHQAEMSRSRMAAKYSRAPPKMSSRRIDHDMKKIVVLGALVLFPVFAFAQSIPRTDGKPNFNGVWAGPGFTHRVGPGDTDSPRVTTYDTAKMSPFKPGGDAFMNRKA